MNRYIGQRSIKSGSAPGTLVHIGKRKTDKVSVSVIEYDEDYFNEKNFDIDDKVKGKDTIAGMIESVFGNKAINSLNKGGGENFSTADREMEIHNENTGPVKWVNVDGLHDTSILENIGSIFGLHPLVMEDMLNTEQRPKTENYGDYAYIVVKVLKNAGIGRNLITEHQSLVLGKNFVFSAGETGHRLFEPVRDRLKNRGRIRKMGADYLAYSLIDTIVDNYFDMLEVLGERIETTEEMLVSKPTTDTLIIINDLKRDMLYIHKSIWPLREVVGLLEKDESQLVRESTHMYIRDLYDHVIQVMDTTEIYRDVLSGMLDIYLSSLSNRMNEIMKVLTIIATLFIPLTFLAGLYGMNFRFMPELEWRWGYFALLLVMAVVTVSMLAFFRHKKWL